MTPRPSSSFLRSAFLSVPALLLAAGSVLAQDQADASGSTDGRAAAPAGQEEPTTPSTSFVGIGGGQGVSREEMWYAPTAEDWAKPVLLTFQRTWEDAVAVSRATGRPILICVNMDGEIASEHYAGIRYRQEDTAALYEPYVCVIASVYRHTPRDHDHEGKRVLCPRFGSVTCGEHIRIEPLLFERYFEGTRVAPRHIGVEVAPVGAAQQAAAETYDVYYAFDVESVFGKITEGVAGRTFPPRDPGADLPLEDLVASRDVRHRELVEEQYRTGDREVRRRILQRAASTAGTPPVDVLRMAVFGLDVELSQMARELLARAESEDVVGLIAEALRVPMDPVERDALIQSLERIGAESELARTLAVVHRGLSSRSATLAADEWTRALDQAEYVAPERSALESKVDYSVRAAQDRPDDWRAKLDLAEASLGLAVDPSTLNLGGGAADRFMRLHLQEALRNAEEAETLGGEGWRLNAVLALTHYYLGGRERAYTRAEAAVAGLPTGESSWTGMAALGLFAEARREGIRRALRARTSWPQEWIADVHDAYTVLGNHPLGTDAQAVAHYDFLDRFGVAGQATAVLERAIQRFPDSWDLHARLRSRILVDRGLDELEPTYEALVGRDDASPNMSWFAGYASIVAGEKRRSSGELDKADAAYGRAVAHYDETIARSPETRITSDFYAAIALAGRARVELTRGELETAIGWIEASVARDSNAADVLDGLNMSAVGTAKMLRGRALRADDQALAARVDAVLGQLDPSQLLLPAFEAGGPRPQAGGGGTGRRERGSNGGGRRQGGGGARRGGQDAGGDDAGGTSGAGGRDGAGGDDA